MNKELNNEEIRKIVDEISEKFKLLEELLKTEGIEKVDIVFPKGVIRTADEFRNRLNFISDYTLKSNISYHLMLTDLYRWILNRFNLRGTIQEMLIKEGISLMGNIVEAVIKYIALNGSKASSNIGFKKACSILKEKGIITQELKKNLEWLWGMRCKEHLLSLPEREYKKYDLEHYNKAILIWQSLEKTLSEKL